jgi:hypothetical protein
MRKFIRTAAYCALIASVCGAADVWLKDDGLVAKVEKKVHAFEPTREERKFDLVAWVPDIFTAKEIAKKQNRPVFFFTYDGNIDTGRC